MAPIFSLDSYTVSIFSKQPAPLSPLETSSLLRARNPSPSKPYTPGSGTVDPLSISNPTVLAVFALLGAGLVGVSIWFFFWAKNGGFRFRKGDWEDYKSTVLRRKGPNGTTLSGATKTTELGGGSIIGSSDRDVDFVDEKSASRRKKAKGNKNNHDNDVRAYRHEKPARVGGLNREADGSYHDQTASDPSETSARPQPARTHKLNKAAPSPHKPAARDFSYSAGTEATFSVASDDSHLPLRTPAHARHSPASQPRQQSPAKRNSARQQPPSRNNMPGNYTDPIDFDSRYSNSDAGMEQAKNTKAYFHPLPGLSRTGGDGFRRGGGRRRDSLSDSEGETGTVRS